MLFCTCPTRRWVLLLQDAWVTTARGHVGKVKWKPGTKAGCVGATGAGSDRVQWSLEVTEKQMASQQEDLPLGHTGCCGGDRHAM